MSVLGRLLTKEKTKKTMQLRVSGANWFSGGVAESVVFIIIVDSSLDKITNNYR